MTPKETAILAPIPTQQKPRLTPANGALPSLQPPAWPGTHAIDPRSTQPGYQPGNNSDPFTGFTYLSLGSVNENTISFGAELQREQWPGPMVLTLIPNSQDLKDLQLEIDGSELDLYYKIEYVFDAQYPRFVDGNVLQKNPVTRSATPITATPTATDGYRQLNQCGIKTQVSGWAFKIWILGVGEAATRAANWQTLGAGSTPLNVRFDAFLAPGSWAPRGSDPYQIGNPSLFLPTFARRIKLPAPDGVVGGTFDFEGLGEDTIVTYPLSDNLVPIPARAVRVQSADAEFGEIEYY